MWPYSGCSVSFNLLKVQLPAELENIPLFHAVTLPEGAFTVHSAARRGTGPRVHAASGIAVQFPVGRVLFLVVRHRVRPQLQPPLRHSCEVRLRLAGGIERVPARAGLEAVQGRESGPAEALKGLKFLDGRKNREKFLLHFSETIKVKEFWQLSI